MTWHPPGKLLDSYGSGQLAASQVWSVEAHVGECARCRVTIASRLDNNSSLMSNGRLDEIWNATIDRIDTPRARIVERLMTALGVPDHVARLLGATPSLTVPWLLAVVAVLGFGLTMAWSSAGDSPESARLALIPFLVMAPLVPLAGVAVAFGPVVDPAYEVAVASPFHGFRLLLVRTVAVVASSVGLALVIAVLLPNAGLLAAAWVLPALALAATALALSTLMSPQAGVAISAATWLAGVTASEIGPRSLAAFGWTGQLFFAGTLAVAALVLLLRREVFEGGQHV